VYVAHQKLNQKEGFAIMYEYVEKAFAIANYIYSDQALDKSPRT
jgi:hypothetical protein